MIVPVVAGPRLAELALRTAARLGGQVIAVAVDLDHSCTAELQAQWARWNPGYDLLVLPSPHRILVGPVEEFVDASTAAGHQLRVLLAEVRPRRRRYQILHHQRGLVLAAALRARTDIVVATVPFRSDSPPAVTGARGSSEARSAATFDHRPVASPVVCLR